MNRPAIGSLRHRLRLEAPIRTADGAGGASVAWASVAEVWADVRPSTGTETVASEAVSGRISHEIIVRHRADVVPAMRFRLGGRILEILAVLDIDERRRHLRCLCREEFQ